MIRAPRGGAKQQVAPQVARTRRQGAFGTVAMLAQPAEADARTPRMEAPNQTGVAKRLAFLVGGLLAGAFVGSLANTGLILAGSAVLPAPDGVDVNDVTSIDANIARYSTAQLLVPFVAHAVGTLVGAWLAARVARRGGMAGLASGLVGALFLAGGIYAVSLIPSAPLWFDALDLLGAYIPMAWLGHHLAKGRAADPVAR